MLSDLRKGPVHSTETVKRCCAATWMQIECGLMTVSRELMLDCQEQCGNREFDSTQAGTDRLKGRSIYAPCLQINLALARGRCTEPLGLDAPVMLKLEAA